LFISCLFVRLFETAAKLDSDAFDRRETAMISERVRIALQEDLSDAVRQVEALGLWVWVGGGRIAGVDLQVLAPGSAPGSAPGPIAATRMGRSKKNAESVVTRMEHPGHLAVACEACGEALKTSGRGSGNRKVPLCKKHAGRWFEYRKHNGESGYGESGYAAWLANQKSGGGRLKKA
jgi:hypothetical protein